MERSALLPSNEVLVDTVARYPGCTWRELILVLDREGWTSIARSKLNSRLYQLKDDGFLDWQPGIGNERRWYDQRILENSERLINSGQVADISSEEIESNFLNRQTTEKIHPNAPDRIELYDWQKEALNEWENARCQGIIQAVTGAGKTRVAIAAAADVLRKGGKVAILVPSIDLLYQWKREVERLLIQTLRLNISVDALGDGKSSDLNHCDLLLATIQSACTYELFPEESGCLLIADEVHRYGSERWALALESGFDLRLGLTATYERTDNGCSEYLDPYFGGVVFKVDYKRALAEGIIAPFKIAFIGVSFSDTEREEYDEYDEKVSKYRRRLINQYGLPEEPFGEFMREVTIFSKSGEEGARWAGYYLNAFEKRRKVLAGAVSKYRRLADLVESVRKADRTIIFSQTKEAAKKATEPFIRNGINGAVLESGMKRLERQQVLAGFESGEEYDLVAAPKLLDEGVDVAAADLAIILASSRSQRQMIQRMGRVLRRKEDGRMARLAVLYVQDTSEDPDIAHEGFLELVTDVAQEIRTFDARASRKKICRYLNP